MKVLKKFSVASVGMTLASSLVCSHAFANGHYEIWNPTASTWIDAASPGIATNFSGAVYFSYLGISLPCVMTMTWLVVNGTAKVTSISLADYAPSTACSHISASSLPWNLAPPLPVSGGTLPPSPANAVIQAVNFTVPYFPATCSGNVPGVLAWDDSVTPTAPSNFSFNVTLGSSPGCQFGIYSSPLSTTSYPKIRGVYP